MGSKPVAVPEVVLNSGHKMPVVGMGTSAVPLPPEEELIAAFINAIKVGYRHFDTAALYGTEPAVGRAVKQALEQGLIKSRDELFITTKLWCSDAHRDLVLPALKKSLENLGLDYVDLYLIHWPLRLKPGTLTTQISKDDVLPLDINGVWEGMEEVSRLGLAKSIGVSNFGTIKLTQLLSRSTIPPAVNQVEMNAGWQQGKLRAFCKEKGIYVCAWSSLGAPGTFWGSAAVIQSSVLESIAKARGKTVAQVALRWIYQDAGAVAIAKSFNKERMRQNIELFDWELSEEDLEKIKQLPQKRGTPANEFIFEGGPFKSLDDLWDGDA